MTTPRETPDAARPGGGEENETPLREARLGFVGVGVTAEAIYQMEKGGPRTVLSKAVYAACQRAAAPGWK